MAWKDTNASDPRVAGTREVIISVEGLGKLYQLYDRPQDRLKQAFLWGRKQLYREFWALRDIAFEVKKGDSVGVIGRNGSGKSTLLQIIAGTLVPTTGQVHVRGRVAALLELGSGFNPEFTGRENVYMNGAILGLSRTEIDDLYQQIVDFADIGQFIDQPIKLYSSGMIVRLAFAVQAFVPKEVLIVDEALAVGDEAFQRKCMVALEQFRDRGGTVLLVSHDTQTIVRQCERCLLLSQGELLVQGASKPVTDLYQKLMYSEPSEFAEIADVVRQHGLQAALSHWQKTKKAEPTAAAGEETMSANSSRSTARPVDWFDKNMPQPNQAVYGNGDVEITDCGFYNESGERVNVLVVGCRYQWEYVARFERDAENVQFGMMLKTVDGVDVAGISSDRQQIRFDHVAASSVYKVSFSMRLNLAPGAYFLNVGVKGTVKGECIYLQRRVDVCMIRVIPCDSCETYGLAYLEPRISCVLTPASSSSPISSKADRIT
jgi:lipopolysaccharide transport system ATP-binding protein